MQLLREIEISLKVAESDVSWAMKYSMIFQRQRECIRPILDRYGLEFTWNDHDSSEEEDVRAYISALEALKDELKKLPDGCFDYVHYQFGAPK